MRREVRCPQCSEELDIAQDTGRTICPYCGTELDAHAFGQTAAVGPGSDAGARKRAGKSDLPAIFGRYRIDEQIARGGMGVVYKAYDPSLNRTVALKVLLGAEHSSEEDIERFFREAESAARLQHPNIVPIHELDVFEGRHYYTMEFIEGRPLSEFTGLDRPPVRDSLKIVEKVARALHYAHQAGVIHRDLKPANIIIDGSGEPRVTDFGLAKITGEGLRGPRDLTRSGVAMGTPDYMAPEQASGRSSRVDARTDVYALGCVLYELLTGKPPFTGPTAMDTLARHVDEVPAAPNRKGAQVAPDAETICLKCLEKEPERRYASAADLAEDLRRFLDGEPIAARRASVLYLLRRWLARHRALACVAGLAVVGLAVLGGWARHRIISERKIGEDRAIRQRQAVQKERLKKADESAAQGQRIMYKAYSNDQQREANLIEAKARFREALAQVPDHLKALHGMVQACTLRWRMMNSSLMKMRRAAGGAQDRREYSALLQRSTAEQRELIKYSALRGAALRKREKSGKPEGKSKEIKSKG